MNEPIEPLSEKEYQDEMYKIRKRLVEMPLRDEFALHAPMPPPEWFQPNIRMRPQFFQVGRQQWDEDFKEQSLLAMALRLGGHAACGEGEEEGMSEQDITFWIHVPAFVACVLAFPICIVGLWKSLK